MQNQILYNNEFLKYTILRKNVKNINLRVLSNAEIMVSCAEDVDIKEVECLIYKRIKWVLKRINYFKENSTIFESKIFDFVDGETFIFDGVSYRIKVIKNSEFKVVMEGRYVKIYKPEKCNLIKLFNYWLEDKINNYFNEILNKADSVFLKYIEERPRILLKNMATRWGTCNTKKRIITLNKNLYKISSYLSEYIIFHEYTHLVFRNHNIKFYSFLTSVIPDWKKRDKNINLIRQV